MDEIIKLARSLEVIIAMFIGAFTCWLGYRLFEKGVSGKASLSAEHKKIKFQLLNASPGIFFALFGSVLVLISVSQKTSPSFASQNFQSTKSCAFSLSYSSAFTLPEAPA